VKPGYFSEQELTEDNFQPEPIELSEEATSITIRLTPEAVISRHKGTLLQVHGAGEYKVEVAAQ